MEKYWLGCNEIGVNNINEMKDIVTEISEKIGDGEELSNKITDFFFSIDSAYQAYHDLHEDNWDIVHNNTIAESDQIVKKDKSKFVEKCPVCGSVNCSPDLDFPDTIENCDNCGTEWNCEGEITYDARNDMQYKDVVDRGWNK